MTDILKQPPGAKGKKALLRFFLAAVAMVGSATVLPLQAGAMDLSIRPFKYAASDAQLGHLRERIRDTRWPEKETVADSSQGVQLSKIRELARYWATDYD